ncbi:MAG: hypothetical protein ACLVAW_08890 [Eisenbergiella massiliensis]
MGSIILKTATEGVSHVYATKKSQCNGQERSNLTVVDYGESTVF